MGWVLDFDPEVGVLCTCSMQIAHIDFTEAAREGAYFVLCARSERIVTVDISACEHDPHVLHVWRTYARA